MSLLRNYNVVMMVGQHIYNKLHDCFPKHAFLRSPFGFLEAKAFLIDRAMIRTSGASCSS